MYRNVGKPRPEKLPTLNPKPEGLKPEIDLDSGWLSYACCSGQAPDVSGERGLAGRGGGVSGEEGFRVVSVWGLGFRV